MNRKLSKFQLFIVTVVAIPTVISSCFILYRDLASGNLWKYAVIGVFIALIGVHARYRSSGSSLDESFRLAERLEKQKRDKR